MHHKNYNITAFEIPAQVFARNTLEALYDYNDYCDCMDRIQNKSSFVEDSNFEEKESPLSIEASPNPATHYVEFSYELSEVDTEGIVIISDMNGSIIHSFSVNYNKGIQAWDTRKIPTGSFIYTLKTKYFEKSGKLIIQ